MAYIFIRRLTNVHDILSVRQYIRSSYRIFLGMRGMKIKYINMINLNWKIAGSIAKAANYSRQYEKKLLHRMTYKTLRK